VLPVAYVDFAKALDSVSHNKLLLKLSGYGLCGILLEWIRNFLSRRICKTKVGGYLSNPLPISSGVIQGSCLGLLLFVIFVNDISDISPDGSTIKLFAGDASLDSTVNTDPQILQNCLQSLAEWSQTWQLSISYKSVVFLTLVALCLTLITMLLIMYNKSPT